MVPGLNAAQYPLDLTYAAMAKGGGGGQQGKGKGKAAGWKGMGKAAGGSGPGGGKGMLHAKAAWLYAQPRQKAPEWTCPGCGTENRATRAMCRECWVPRPWQPTKGKGTRGTAMHNAPVGAFGYGPLLGNRGHNWGATSAKGGSAPPQQQGKGGGKAERASAQFKGNHTGKGGTGFTEVNYATGSRPKVEPPPASNTHTYPTTKFHLLDVDEDAFDDRVAQEQVDAEEQQEAGQVDEGFGCDDRQEQSTGEDLLQAAKARLWMRQGILRQFKAQMGKNHPQTRMAAADVEEALQKMREIRGPKQWHVRAREVERKAEAKERSIAKRHAQIEQNRLWMQQLQQEFQVAQQSLEEANDQEAREARELWDQVEAIKKESSAHEGRGKGAWGMDDGRWTMDDETWRTVADLGQQLAAAQEEAAARGCDDLQQMLAAAGARVAQLEANAEGGHAGEDEDEDVDAWEDEDAGDGDVPPWRRQAGGGKAGRWSNAARRQGGGNEDTPSAGAAAAADGSAMDWATQGTERTRAPKRGATGEAREASGETQGPSQQAREAQQLADEAAVRAAAAQKEARRQRALDKLRGQVQVEKNAEIARRQQEAGVNVVECAQEWTPQQLEQNTKLIEQINKEYEERAERKLAQMSEDEVLRLLEEQGW